jgi:hypothetical protein
MTCFIPNDGTQGWGPLTQGIKGRHQVDIHPVFKVYGCQAELQAPSHGLLWKLKAQSGDWVLPPGVQQWPHLMKDLCTMCPLVLVALEAIEEEDKF